MAKASTVNEAEIAVTAAFVIFCSDALAISTVPSRKGAVTISPLEKLSVLRVPASAAKTPWMSGLYPPKFAESEGGPEIGQKVHVLPRFTTQIQWHKNDIRAHGLGKAKKIGLSTSGNTFTKAVNAEIRFKWFLRSWTRF